ncbi:MAG: response regulator [Paenibacillaceae bacterium]
MSYVLIVDDEPTIRKGLMKMVETYPNRPLTGRTAEHGLQALKMIDEYPPQIVLTDIRMPKMDGLELSKVLQDKYPFIEIIVISGFGDFQYARRCLSYGVKEYLLKPVVQVDLHEVLDKLFERQITEVLSVSRYEQWIEQVDEAIWSLQYVALTELIKEWRIYCNTIRMPLIRLRNTLQECLYMLDKRMNVRSFVHHIDLELPFELETESDVYNKFEEKINEITEELKDIRNGHFKDPMEEAKRFIDNHLSQEISLEEVAEKLGITPTYFSYLFKKMNGETFIQYRIRKRMMLAKSLIEIPHYRIIDIAKEVGYEDYPHFSKTFKKITGFSPSEYRTMMGII